MTGTSGTLLHRRRLLIGAAALVGCLVVAVVLLIHADRGPTLSEATQIHTGATGPTALVPNVVGDTQ